MYKIIIIDDERLVIKSLRATIAWEKYGYKVVGEAYNGADGIKLIEEAKPDLVFIDIRMPGLNGLEVIEKTKKLGLDTLFTVVSGYAEFSYAQKAIKQGAIGYCLKPFSQNDILESLSEATKRLDSIREKKMASLYMLLDEPYQKVNEQLDSELKKLGIYKQMDDGIHFAVIIEKDNSQLKYPSDTIGLRLGRNRYGIFIPKDTIKDFTNRAENDFKGEYVSVGISGAINDTSQLRKGIDEARNAAWYFFITGKTSKVYYGDDANAEIGDALLKDVEKSCYKRDFNKLIDVLTNAKVSMQEGDIKPVHIVRLYNYLRETLSINDNDIKLDEDYISNIEQLAEVFSDSNEVIDMFISLLDKEDNQSQIKTKNVKNVTAKQILEYVNNNYTDDIAIRQISKIFFINPSYLSQLFKKEFGETFTSYLMKLRIEHACNLLTSTSMPISEIAEKSGYTDYFYFARVFKKITNKTASEYRFQ